MAPTRIVTFGNCQAEGLKRLLDRTLPAGHRIEFFSNNWRTDAMRPPEDILGAIGEADVVVYQPLKETHGELRNENVRATATGQAVAFPYLYNAGISGLCQGVTAQPARRPGPGPRDALGFDVREHGLVFGEEAIISRLRDGMSANEVADAYRGGEIDFRIRSRFEQSVSEIKRREASTELRFSTFIRANHAAERLFLTHRHPTTALYLELCEQLAAITGLEPDLDLIRDLDDEDVARLGRGLAPVSPADIEAMEYEFGPDEHWERKGNRLIAMIATKFRQATRSQLETAELDPGDAHLADLRGIDEGPLEAVRQG